MRHEQGDPWRSHDSTAWGVERLGKVTLKRDRRRGTNLVTAGSNPEAKASHLFHVGSAALRALVGACQGDDSVYYSIK